MSTEITAAFKAMHTDIQVSMDDVVSAFVSQYETNLFKRKKELTASIKVVEKTASDLVSTVHKEINGASFVKPLPLGLIAEVDEGTIDWDKKKVHFEITVKEKGTSSTGYYSNKITVHEDKTIPAAQVRANKKLEEELSELRSDLGEILVSLKSVTRKEREVRGRIAIRKLEDSGYANLMQDGELAQLVQLDD